MDDRKSPTRATGLPSWVPDWTRPAPVEQCPVCRGYFILESPMFTLQDPAIIACRATKPDNVLRVSSALSVKSIRLSTRFDFENNRDLPLEWGSLALKELLLDVYDAWRNVVHNDEILPFQRCRTERHYTKRAFYIPERSKQTVSRRRILTKKTWRNHGSTDPVGNEYLYIPNILTLLAYALWVEADINYVEGKALARMASGRLALVPAYTRPGDIIAPLDDGTLTCFLFRPLQEIPDITTINARIHNIFTNYIWRYARGQYINEKQIFVESAHSKHVTLLGECFVDSTPRTDGQWNPYGHRGDMIVIAIH